ELFRNQQRKDLMPKEMRSSLQFILLG
ncbi:MAG: hypothetical protein RJA81_1509, partial [Planctomycetota bacterium]